MNDVAQIPQAFTAAELETIEVAAAIFTLKPSNPTVVDVGLWNDRLLPDGRDFRRLNVERFEPAPRRIQLVTA